MMSAIRAVYENGNLRLLDPVELREGQEVTVHITTSRESLIALFGDRLANASTIQIDPALDEEEQFLRDIADNYQGPSASEAIIEERREGP